MLRNKNWKVPVIVRNEAGLQHPITQADLLKKIDGADQELLGKAQDGRFLHGMTGQLAKLLHRYSTMQLQVKNTHSYTCMHLQVSAASPRM